MKKILLRILTLSTLLFCINTATLTIKAADNNTEQSSQASMTPQPSPSVVPSPSPTPSAPVTAAPQIPGTPTMFRIPSLETRPTRSGDYDYIVTDETNKLAILTGIYGLSEELIIPSAIDGYTIVQVGYAREDLPGRNVLIPTAMYLPNPAASPSPTPSYTQTREINVIPTLSSTVKKIVFPNTVKNIGYSAFSHLNSLTEVTFPASLNYISSAAFFMCSKIQNLNINSNVIIDDSAFAYCKIDNIVLNGSINNMQRDENYYGMEASAKKVTIKNNSSIVIQKIGARDFKIEQLIVEKGVDNVRISDGVQIQKTYIFDKNTQFSVWANDSSPSTYVIAEKGAAAIKTAKKAHWKYKTIDIPKVGKVKMTKKGKKYISKWNPVKITIKTYIYDTDSNKWGIIKQTQKPVYVIKSNGKTTNSKKCSFTSKKKAKPSVTINHLSLLKKQVSL